MSGETFNILAEKLTLEPSPGSGPSVDQLLTVARQQVLDVVLERKRETHEKIAPQMDRALAHAQSRLPADAVSSPAYQTGRLHGLGDALAESYERLPHAELENALQNPDFREMIDELRSGPRTNSELAARFHKDPAVISRVLGRLDGAGVVSRVQQGRHVMNSLSPAAWAILDHNVVGDHRMPHAPHPDSGIVGRGELILLSANRRAA